MCWNFSCYMIMWLYSNSTYPNRYHTMKIQAKSLQQELQSGKKIALIDVRSPVEHDEMHISGSHLMPLDQLDATAVQTLTAGKDRCVLICRSGKRAEQAMERLGAAGCQNMTILEGGVTSWESAGFPLERSTRRHLPLMRQVQLIIGLLALTGSLLALTIHKNFALLPALLGAGLTMAGSTGWCGLAILLSKMPWNKVECGGSPVKSCSL
jgi:rhodanese-related sulfurtransferase